MEFGLQYENDEGEYVVLNDDPTCLRIAISGSKRILHHRSTTNPIITFKNHTATSPKEKAELFNTYFCSVFRPAQSTEINEAPSTLLTSAWLSDISISKEEVVHHLWNLDPSKSPGPDNIPGLILSNVALPSLLVFVHCLITLLKLELYLLNGNLQMLHRFTRKIRRNLLLTTAQYPYFPSSVKSWSAAFAIVSMIISMR